MGNSQRSSPILNPSPTSGTGDLEQQVVTLLEDDKAEDIAVVSLIGKTSFADKMIIATGKSQRHVGAIADHLVDKLKSLGVPRLGVEGKELCDWVLIDAGDLVIHVFRPEIRDVYDLERMWTVEAAEPASMH